MSKGLNPQDVANALTDRYRQIRKDSDGWAIPVPEKVDKYKGVVICRTKNDILLPFNIDWTGVPEGTIFEKQEEFEDGELVIYIDPTFGDNYEAGRYYGENKVYKSSIQTGRGEFYSCTPYSNVNKIIKYKGNESLLGTEAK